MRKTILATAAAALLFFAGSVEAQYGPPSGGTITAPILGPDGTAAAPTYSFANDTDLGFFRVTGNVLGFAAGGAERVRFASTYVAMGFGASGYLGLGGTVGVPSVYLYAPSANTLALRNGANTQTFNIYNTYTDASNGEWGYLKWDSNVFMIGTDENGTGTSRSVWILADNGQVFIGKDSSTVYYQFQPTYFRPQVNDQNALGQPSYLFTEAYLGRGTLGSKTTTLTESSATDFIEIEVDQGDSTLGEFTYKIHADDGTNVQVIGGRGRYSAVNESGTVACTIADVGTAVDNTPTGTLTNTFSCAEDNADKVMLKANAVSSLTQTTLEISWRIDSVDAADAITPQ